MTSRISWLLSNHMPLPYSGWHLLFSGCGSSLNGFLPFSFLSWPLPFCWPHCTHSSIRSAHTCGLPPWNFQMASLFLGYSHPVSLFASTYSVLCIYFHAVFTHLQHHTHAFSFARNSAHPLSLQTPSHRSDHGSGVPFPSQPPLNPISKLGGPSRKSTMLFFIALAKCIIISLLLVCFLY